MDFKEPHFNADILSKEALTYLWVVFIALWGGAVSYLDSHLDTFSWRHFITHLCSSSFAGLLTAFICIYSGMPAPLMGAMAGVAGHMGTKAALRLRIVRRFLEKLDMTEEEKEN